MFHLLRLSVITFIHYCTFWVTNCVANTDLSQSSKVAAVNCVQRTLSRLSSGIEIIGHHHEMVSLRQQAISKHVN